ncbi:N amino acid transport system [Lecanosticta acicola]|uniref:N amino acid transport system n=1 Tax=Lecanosticta acicola TaxID=111012 RepID=A0AAI9E902_9PEZI|nr:N amino acid transport system [Lecanosticta acicola]
MSGYDEKKTGEALAPVPTTEFGSVQDYPKVDDATHDAVFGEISEDGPNYRDVGWMGTVILMCKTQIGLGVLGIPGALHTLGMIPGVIILIIIAIMTTWCGHMVGKFKLLHPQVYGIDDAGKLMGGRIGREILWIGFILYFTFLSASAMLSISIGFNALSVHGACTAIFVVVAALIGFLFGSIQTLGKVSWIAWIGVAGILTAVFTLTIAVGVQDRPADAPQTGPYVRNFEIIGHPTFADGISAVSTIVFAFAGTPAFFSIVSEMRNPRDFTKSLCVAQTIVTLVYLVVGIVVYYYCGSYVASPALGSAGPLMKRVCYGLALPGLVASCMLFVHLPAKSAFMRIMRGSEHLTKNTPIHWMAWLGCTATITIVAYLIGSGIPVFDGLISLIGALLATAMSFQPMGLMWLYDNFKRSTSERDSKWWIGVTWAFWIVIIGTFIMIAGTYGSIVGIINADRTTPWSCADNSGSV